MPTKTTSSKGRARDRARGAARWFTSALRSRSFWGGLLLIIGTLGAIYLVMNHVLMPMYTRQNAEIVVPEVRELSFDQAVRLIEGRRLRPERRDQPFNPAFARDVVIDQNPSPNATVKPGRRIYLYVNSGTERTVLMPEVRTLTESVARSQLSEIGLIEVSIRADATPSPYPGTVTRQAPESGEPIRTSERVTLWVSTGLGEGVVEVPDVRGEPYENAVEQLEAAGLWVDPTRAVSGTITRQEPAAGSSARRGTEVRLSSVPIEDEPAPFVPEEFEEGIPDDGGFDEETMSPTQEDPGRDAARTDW